MKDSLISLIKNSILLEYQLPIKERGIEKTIITTKKDDCYKSISDEKLSRIIYESILYYSYSNFELDGGNHSKMFLKAFNRKFKYNANSSELAKRKLGIYGEALLHAILINFYGTATLMCRGHFYDSQKRSEVTGYDAFHLIERKGETELWFGETKFHEKYKSAINDVIKNIYKALSDDYLEINFDAIVQRKSDDLKKSKKLLKIIERWEKCNADKLINELKSNNIKLVYPILIAFTKEGDYNDAIQNAVNHIKERVGKKSLKKMGIDVSIFFIFLPVEDVKTVKTQIIEWISTAEPLM